MLQAMCCQLQSLCPFAKGCVSASCPWDEDQLCFPPVRLVCLLLQPHNSGLVGKDLWSLSSNLLLKAGLASELEQVV